MWNFHPSIPKNNNMAEETIFQPGTGAAPATLVELTVGCRLCNLFFRALYSPLKIHQSDIIILFYIYLFPQD
jgi:hypothetical protein